MDEWMMLDVGFWMLDGLVCAGLVWFGLVWFGLVWFGFGLVWSGREAQPIYLAFSSLIFVFCSALLWFCSDLMVSRPTYLHYLFIY